METDRSLYPIGVGRPIMFSGMATLILGGVIGVLWMLKYQGVDIVWEGLPGIDFHWFLMIYGFLFSLISVEIFALLSFEWSGRVASIYYRLLFLALFWASVILWIYGERLASLTLVSINMVLLSIYASSIFLKPGRLGFKPTHYNMLLTLTPIITFFILIIWVLQIVIRGASIYEISIASLIFPLGSIVAVESRDIPLLTEPHRAGVKPASHRGVVIGYGVLAVGVVISSFTRIHISSIIGGALIVLGSALAFKDLGLLSSLGRGAGGGIVPSYMARYAAIHIVTAFSWLVLGGVVFMAMPLLSGVAILPMDLAIHAIALGFIFNTLFGVDAILMYSHAGISLRIAPKPSYIPYALLNTSLLLRALYDLTGIQGITLVSAPLTGISIILFFVVHNIRLSRLRRMTATARVGGGSHS